MNGWAQYKALLRAEMGNALFHFTGQSRREKPRSRGASVALTLLGWGIVVAYLCIMSVNVTLNAYRQGTAQDLLYLFLLGSQLIVLIFSLSGGINSLYFSQDNLLLSTLPVQPIVRFGAKFTLLYLGELLFSVVSFVPMAYAHGITLAVLGSSPGWGFFVLVPFAALLIPAFPLLLVSLLSVLLVPFYLALRRTRFGKVLFFVCVFALYGLLMLPQMFGEDPAALGAVFQGVRTASPFNFLIAEALLGVHPAGYFFAYLAQTLAIVAIALGISAPFYRRLLQMVLEGEGGSKPKRETRKQGEVRQKKGDVWARKPLLRSFLLKEWQNLVHTPSLLVSALLPIVLLPVLAVVLSVMFRHTELEDASDWMVMQFTIVSMLNFVGVTLSSVHAMVAFSIEGKRLYLLKTMPIPTRTLLLSKMILPIVLNFVYALVVGVALSVSLPSFSPTVLIGSILLVNVHGYGATCVALRADLKKPNLNWNNVNELTNNNMRSVRAMLLSMGIGLGQMVMGILVMAFLFHFLYKEVLYVIYYAVALIPSGLLAGFGDAALRRDAEKLYAQLGE